MHFGDRLYTAIEKTSPICVGIDPRLDLIPSFITQAAHEEFGNTPKGVAEAFIDFSYAIIDSVKDLVPAVKPQLAFFEMYGSEGIRAFEEVCNYATEQGLIVIADGKRNDIGSTAEAYARGFLGSVPLFEGATMVNKVDALTVTPYLGSDGILPFIDVCNQHDKGIFVLVKTSNPSAGDIQDLPAGDELVHEHLAHLVGGWGMECMGQSGFSSVGAVVGATYGEEIAYLRSLMPNQFFLVPGYGAQGATAEDIARCFNADRTGAIINSSRDILYAYKKGNYSEENFDEAARDAVMRMKQDIESVL